MSNFHHQIAALLNPSGLKPGWVPPRPAELFTFDVEVHKTVTASLTIAAESYDDAVDKARDLVDSGQATFEDYGDLDFEASEGASANEAELDAWDGEYEHYYCPDTGAPLCYGCGVAVESIDELTPDADCPDERYCADCAGGDDD